MAIFVRGWQWRFIFERPVDCARQFRDLSCVETPVVTFWNGFGFKRRQFHALHFFDAMSHIEKIAAQQIAADP